MGSNDKRQHSEGHRQRLRERFLNGGLDGFHDYEIVELLLTLGTPRRDCKSSAKDAIEYFGSFQAVLEAPPEELCKIKGIGPKNLFGLKLIKAAADRYLEKKVIKTDPICNSKELFDYLFHTLRDKKREHFNAIFLDAKNRIIKSETLFVGTLTASSVYPREVVSAALRNHAAALIFTHNHPSGDPTPSAEDIAITRQLVFACRVMGIFVHEHIVVGNNCYYSFADKGIINKMHKEFDLQKKDLGEEVF